LRRGGGWKGENDLGFWEEEDKGEKGKAGEGGGLAARKGESDLGLWEGERKEEGEMGKAGGGGGVDGC
jgi:hypothetical protein